MTKPQPPQTKTIALRHGVEVDGAAVTAMSMRPPLARDSVEAQRGGGSPGEVEIRLFSNLCQQPPDAIGRLHMADYALLQDAFNSFLE